MSDEKQIEIKIGKTRLIGGGIFAGVVLLFLLAVRFIAQRNEGMTARSREAVSVGPPVPAQDERQRVFVAVALSEQAVDLTTMSTATVEAFLVEMGAPVKAGTPLARLASEDTSRDAAGAQAAAKQAEAEVERADAEYKSAKQKQEARKVEGVVSNEERQQSEIAVKVAAANLEIARQKAAQVAATAAKAKARADQLVLRAPFDGTLAARYQNVGAPVTAGSRIVRFIGGKRPLVRFAVPQEQASALKVGDKAAFRPESGQPDDVAIARIAPEADPHSGLVVVEATLAETAGELRPGTVGKIELSRAASL